MLKVLLFHISCLLVLCQSEHLPGYRIRVTDLGLKYAAKVGGDIVQSVIEGLKIPPIHVSASGVTLNVDGIKVNKFTGAAFEPTLQPPDGVMLKMTGGDIEAVGRFSGKVWLTGVKGTVKVSAKGTGLNAAVLLNKDSSGRPTISYSACTALIDDFDIDLSGSFFVTIVNWFHKLIANSIKPNLLKTICSELKTVIDVQVHQILSTIPTKIPIDGTEFSIDYTLIDRPVVTKDYVDIDGRGVIDIDGKNTDPNEPDPIHPSGPTDKYMAYFWGSQFILDSALYQLQVSDHLKYLVNKDTVPGSKSILATTCAALCVGTILKEVGKDYPNTYAQLFLNGTGEIPKIRITTDGAYLNANLTLDLSVEQQEKVLKIAGADLALKADVVPSLRGGNITGKAYITELSLTQTYSALKDPIAWMFLEKVSQNILQNEINHILHVGIPVPSFEGISVVRPTIALGDGAIEVATDIDFNNPFEQMWVKKLVNMV